MFRAFLFSGCLFILAGVFQGCEENSSSTYQGAGILHTLSDELTNAIVQDGFSPPVASRIYAYSYLAAYECLAPFDPELVPLSGQLNGLSAITPPDDTTHIHYELAAIHAFCNIARDLVYRDFIMDTVEARLKGAYSGLPEADQQKSLEWGDKVVMSIRERIGSDNYTETRKMERYDIQRGPGTWEPTPPTYSESIEPHWAMILPFFIDSATQFKPPLPVAYSEESSSDFYASAMEVYETVNNLDVEEENMARFWDCNPMVSISSGHVMYAKRQLTPGGHWIGITGACARQERLGIFKTSEAYTMVSVALVDAFISCWEAKYTTNLIRPETYINNLIDKTWRPVLQTPMFPEHTSGHSVVSAAASEILTNYFGDNYAYVDSVNMPFNLPARSYGSFYEAAREAAGSRLLGGIHYRAAIDYGIDQGSDIGKYLLKTVHTRAEDH